MLREKKPSLSLRWRVLLFLVLYPVTFFLIYMPKSTLSWKTLGPPFLLACVFAVLESIYEQAFSKRANSQPKTDWPERIWGVLLFTLFMAGSVFCAAYEGYTGIRDGIRSIIGSVIALMLITLFVGLYHNDPATDEPQSGLPSRLPSLPYLLFPSGRRKP
ncbi:MAG: hypothetical protein WBE20_12920 [Candidatus Acidiferrales bacterium]